MDTDPVKETQTSVKETSGGVGESGSAAVTEVPLSQYCFTRNHMLLTIELPDPQPEIASAIDFFDQLEEPEKQAFLPVLDQFFNHPEEFQIGSVAPAWQDWLKVANSDPVLNRSIGAWMSRYCANPEGTMVQINHVLKSNAAVIPSSTEAFVEGHFRDVEAGTSAAKAQPGRSPDLMKLLARFWYAPLLVGVAAIGFAGLSIFQTVGPSTVGNGQVLSNYTAIGSISRAKQKFSLSGAAAVWNPETKELRIALLPVSVTSGDVNLLQQLLKNEGSDRVPESMLAQFLVKSRPSHDPRHFATMPVAQLDIQFEGQTPNVTAGDVKAYNLLVKWPTDKENAIFGGITCYSGQCKNPKAGLKITTFEPQEGGTVKLTVKPDGDTKSSGDFRITVQVNTKVTLQK